MNPVSVAVAVAVAVPAAFAVGVIFHKYVISEAEAIRAHVTGAEQRIRGEIAAALRSTAGKL